MKILNDIKIDRPIFVIGFPRSGTTVISEVLSSHEKVGWISNYLNLKPNLPQLSLINRIIDLPSIGLYLRGKKKQGNSRISFLRKVLPHSVEAYGIWEKYCGPKFLFDYLLNRSATANEIINMRRLVQNVLFYHGKSRFLAKYTGPSRIKYVNSIFPNSYFIHVIRDPRAVVSSIMDVNFWDRNKGKEAPWWKNGLKDIYLEEWRLSNNSPLSLAVIQWKQIIEYAREEGSILGNDRYIEVKYENFVKSPQSTIDDLLNRIDLPRSEKIVRYIKSFEKINDMNFKYKSNFSPADINEVERSAYKIAKTCNYLLFKN
jgi:hypothetical protein